MLRRRAERLLADVQQIELRKTGFEDTQRLLARWSKWGHSEGECTKQHCQISITFADFFDRHHSLWKRESLKLLYSGLGGRPTSVHASIEVIDGVVWEKRYSVDSASRSIVSGQASTVSWLPAVDQRFVLHPNHRVVPLTLSPCVWILSEFTPYADPAEVRRLMEFNLSIITLRCGRQPSQFAKSVSIQLQHFERADLDSQRGLYVRLQRQHVDEGSRVEHHELRMGLREPAEQRHATRLWWNDFVRVRPVRPTHQESHAHHDEYLRLRR